MRTKTNMTACKNISHRPTRPMSNSVLSGNTQRPTKLSHLRSGPSMTMWLSRSPSVAPHAGPRADAATSRPSATGCMSPVSKLHSPSDGSINLQQPNLCAQHSHAAVAHFKSATSATHEKPAPWAVASSSATSHQRSGSTNCSNNAWSRSVRSTISTTFHTAMQSGERCWTN